ncbi:MAG: hypothetical protein D9V45_03685 [Chloroflexi bacterium]|nr:MAG: hypothetical protein D9V45_03685 [Chloroflexota bacterium]
MNLFNAPLTIHQGAVTISDQPVMLVSADYPYYRDRPDNWRDRLTQLKALGLQVVTCYIPWRHHQPDAASQPDFTGATQPNRNVIGFLQLCKELDLAVVVKPGPFIHAETNYGGLPDWTCPVLNSKIEPLRDAQGNPCMWGGATLDASGKRVVDWSLPAPFDPEFLRLTREWLAWVGQQVIAPFASPQGPIVAAQAANEGIYSNGQHAPWAYDYSKSGLQQYQAFVQTKYTTLKNYNRLHEPKITTWEEVSAPREWDAPAKLTQLRKFIDWGEFQAKYMALIFTEWSQPLGTHLPVVVNQNPPLDTPYGLDAWLTRVEPEVWQGKHYGFTNWVGDVSARPSAFGRYLLTAKRAPGINWEENWGFAELYDPAYVEASTSFYQTLLVLNGGATGFNIYTGVATAHVDANMDILGKTPYPDAAPVNEHGELTPKAETVRWLTDFLAVHGSEFIHCQPLQVAGWGFYLPYVRAAAWAPPDQPGVPKHGQHLADFQEKMRAQNLDYAVFHLERATQAELAAVPQLFVAGSMFMSANVQQKLADYVRRGGNLNWVGELPEVDENGAPCRILANIKSSVRVMPAVDIAPLLADPGGFTVNTPADLWLRVHPQKDIQFLTVLIPADGSPQVEVQFSINRRNHHLRLSAAPSGGAIFRLEGGKVTSYLIKGWNAFLGHTVVPHAVFDGQELGANLPGDCVCINGRFYSLQPQLS